MKAESRRFIGKLGNGDNVSALIPFLANTSEGDDLRAVVALCQKIQDTDSAEHREHPNE